MDDDEEEKSGEHDAICDLPTDRVSQVTVGRRFWVRPRLHSLEELQVEENRREQKRMSLKDNM